MFITASIPWGLPAVQGLEALFEESVEGAFDNLGGTGAGRCVLADDGDFLLAQKSTSLRGYISFLCEDTGRFAGIWT